MYGHHTKKQYLDPFQKQWPIELGEIEYSNYLLRSGYNISSINNAFQNVQLLSQETLIRKMKEDQVNVANTPF